ncbi:cytidylate kinase [Mycoplasmoides fastidiosum]|uniref:Cytidylate kinase n=1 Tax=Mycoplasmoides fastidiosum TaxID=92758 RepID=A0ABU0LYP5_9BACT|nr:(d)CMP kinase [Mycoplasmoides fastidiosum]MDQ0513831.1 cytidylate kinase [Mycoplasmoides fastidiosum]UUD37752.1 (d)CMP kinase [Mycoplasmoides fastidiosum]
MKFQIAIDGPSGVGKSATAQKVANALDFLYVNTGFLFRGLAYVFQQKKLANPQITIEQMIEELRKQQNFASVDNQIYYQKKLINDFLSNSEIAKLSSELSQNLNIRNFILDLERQIANNQQVVMEGRDIGTVVLPNAFLKIFLTASVDVRAQRRFSELKRMGKLNNQSLDEIKYEISMRDEKDRNRELAPLLKAEDAIEILTDNLDLEEVVLKIVGIFLEKLKTSYPNN